VQLTTPTEGTHSQCNLFGNVLAGHTADFATHTTICIKHQVLLAAYYKAVKANTHLFFPQFLFMFSDLLYSILHYFSFFFIHSVISALATTLWLKRRVCDSSQVFHSLISV
jgi:hypothetical protein